MLDKLANNLVEAKRLQDQIERTAAKAAIASKNKSKSKKRGGGKNSRTRALNMDSSDLSSYDSDERVSTASSSRQPYNPNLIVLDCDDEFDVGPAVNFTRNVAAANSVSVEDSMDLKVNVKINGKIEKYQMNSVSQS